MTLGLPGLLDDSYLVIRIIENLEKGPESFLDWDLDHPARFLKRLIGPAVTQQLDRIADRRLHQSTGARSTDSLRISLLSRITKAHAAHVVLKDSN